MGILTAWPAHLLPWPAQRTLAGMGNQRRWSYANGIWRRYAKVLDADDVPARIRTFVVKSLRYCRRCRLRTTHRRRLAKRSGLRWWPSDRKFNRPGARIPWRCKSGAMFLRPLSARAVRAGHKKSRDARLFFFAGRTARSGHCPATPFATTTSARVSRWRSPRSAPRRGVRRWTSSRSASTMNRRCSPYQHARRAAHLGKRTARL